MALATSSTVNEILSLTVGIQAPEKRSPSPARPGPANVVKNPGLDQIVLGKSSELRATGPAKAPRPAVSETLKKPQAVSQLEKLAQDFADAINEVHGTEVKFKVALEQKDSGEIHFKVMDRRTGEIVREFPPEKIIDLAEGTNLLSGEGLFVDEPV